MSKDKKNNPNNNSDMAEVLEAELKEDIKPLEDEIIDITPSSDDKNLPAIREILTPAKTSKDVTKSDPLSLYIREIEKIPLLTLEEEKRLTKELVDTGDIDVAKQLVQSNLRLVVKIAMEYRKAHQNIMDLIQEGNIGLMKAVSKYDPDKGAKLSYYASWWIRSYILKFILDNFRLVKIGTTAEQKKLFFNLMKEKERLAKLGIEPSTKKISETLGVSEKAVALMDKRLDYNSGGEVSIDAQIKGDSDTTFSDFLASDEEDIDLQLGNIEEVDILKQHLGDFLGGLKDRDREIFHKRLLREVPLSLQAIADEYGVSRERIRQIEERLLGKLKLYMSDFLR